MKRLTTRRGLTPITAVLTLTIVMLLATLTSLYMIANTPSNHLNALHYIITPQLPKIESVALNSNLNEVLVNIRIAILDEVKDIKIYLIKENSLRDIPITNVVIERIDNLLLLKAMLGSNIDRGEYLIKMLIGGKNSEIKFTV